MTESEKVRWDEANIMLVKYPNDPYVIENAICIRADILKNVSERLDSQKS